MKYIRWFGQKECTSVMLVGGKNASLATMIQDLSSQVVRIPYGFAVTTDAYWALLESNGARDKLFTLLAQLPSDAAPDAIAPVGKAVRELILSLAFSQGITNEVVQAYQELGAKYSQDELPVAVRSSASAEDLPTASFAGQQESFLHISGSDELLSACHRCYASLFTNRAIAYRQQMGFDHTKVALSIGIQKMVLSSQMSAGVGFSIDTQTGFDRVVIIESSYGLGETLVKGKVVPDKFLVYKKKSENGLFPILDKQLGKKESKLVFVDEKMVLKSVPEYEQWLFSLSDKHIQQLAQAIIEIESFYSKKHNTYMPMDVEWAVDEHDNQLYIVQARPETVHAHAKDRKVLPSQYSVQLSSDATLLAEGIGIGQQAYVGKARLVSDPNQLNKVNKGDIIVTTMSDPDWVPLMKKAGGIVTELGGRTCHAAIVARELNIPAIVGVPNATKIIADDINIVLDCTQSERGMIYKGSAQISVKKLELTGSWEKYVSRIMISLSDPSQAFSASFLPVSGVGLLRLEFVVADEVGIHPLALIDYQEETEDEVTSTIAKRSAAYTSPKDLYIERLAFAISTIAAAFDPRPVIVRLTDFKSNEYRGLVGGEQYEPHESNPMLGFRGASRYTSDFFLPAFELECQAIRKVVVDNGFKNVIVLVPFVRTLQEAKNVCNILHHQRLNVCPWYMMIEVPSNVIMLEEYVRLFDGFSIGSNDLTQLTLAVDRDSPQLASLFHEASAPLYESYKQCIAIAKKNNKYIGLCGQGPTDNFTFAQWLLQNNIDSVSVASNVVLSLIQDLVKQDSAPLTKNEALKK